MTIKESASLERAILVLPACLGTHSLTCTALPKMYLHRAMLEASLGLFEVRATSH